MSSVFAVGLGYGIALPILPFFMEGLLADSGAISLSSHVGMITGVYALSMFLFAPLWGWLSDKIGRRPVILVGLGGFVLMLGSFGFSSELWIAYAIRILSGLFASSILPVASAYIADMGSQEFRARRFAWMGAAGLVGFLAGPMLGGWISGTDGSGLSIPIELRGLGPTSMPFLVAAVLGAAIWVFTFLALPRYARNIEIRQADNASFTSDASGSINALLLLSFLMTFGLGSFEVGLTMYGQQILGIGPERLSQMFVACMLVMIAVQLLVFPFLIKRCPIQFIAPPAFSIMAVGLAMMTTVLDINWLLVVVGLVAAGSGLLAPVMSYQISLAAGASQGAVLGKQAAASSLGQAIGSVIAGLGFGFMGQTLFWGIAAALLISVVLSAKIPLLPAPHTTRGEVHS